MNFLNSKSPISDYEKAGGGKALNLQKMRLEDIPVPHFIAVGNDFFQSFKKNHQISIDTSVSTEELAKKMQETFAQTNFSETEKEEILKILKDEKLLGENLAIRSSGLDEDSKDHSFAGMFSSFLFQKSEEDILRSIKECWASAYSERCLNYRIKNNLSLENIGMGVVIQKMINSETSGVMFTRNPIDITDRKGIVIESVYGQCEGLVSGELEADSYTVDRESFEYQDKISQKTHKFVRQAQGSGLDKVEVKPENIEKSSIDDADVKKIAKLGIKLEEIYQCCLDVEWAIENNELYLVQMRPITSIPNLNFYNDDINGGEAILWDNSNIIESFSGVTTPLTFSLTKEAYETVYKETCRLVGVPESIIADYDYSFKNMLGFIRGRVYYNLINWYQLLFLIPGSSSNAGFMETMMGVKEELNEEQQELFNFVDSVPKYSAFKKIEVMLKLLTKFLRIDSLVKEFTEGFDEIYQRYLKTNFNEKSLKDLKKLYLGWDQTVTYSWKPPIINDFLCMFFFGVLKKITENWVKVEGESFGLQNDLLCGQGELESTKPTLTLMKMATEYDQDTRVRNLFLDNELETILSKVMLSNDYPKVKADVEEYLHLYGFRCNNEQKLEEKDLTDDPLFIIDAIKNYLRSKSYDIEKMKEREHKIKAEAEEKVKASVKGIKRIFFFWILKHARNAVKNRENMRFLRSKSFGITRRIYRAIGNHLHAIDILSDPSDVFYLTYREIFDFIDGKSESLRLNEIAAIRRKEFDEYRETADPPDRFLTYGTVGASFQDLRIIASGDLLKHKLRVSDDPNLIYGISCCPGVVRAKVRVAPNIEDARGLDGEILITKRTDPGWVPLFPSCSGLIVERGSLLSHSAVIARELGLPTIVGVSGEIIDKVKTGDIIELNATQGEIRLNVEGQEGTPENTPENTPKNTIEGK